MRIEDFLLASQDAVNKNSIIHFSKIIRAQEEANEMKRLKSPGYIDELGVLLV
jgi:hypothetical protein